jgi:hypothetical protein
MPDRGSLIPPRPTSAAASSVMKGNRRRDTQPELALRKAMHKRGLRYRVDFPVAAGSRRVRPASLPEPRGRAAREQRLLGAEACTQC